MQRHGGTDGDDPVRHSAAPQLFEDRCGKQGENDLVVTHERIAHPAFLGGPLDDVRVRAVMGER